jgi:uncharacterized membrane protein YfcA
VVETKTKTETETKIRAHLQSLYYEPVVIMYIVIGLAAFAVAGLTLFSGFGLGTLLMPVFALFFPVEVAVAATAVVHGLNNLFKLLLLRGDVRGRLLLVFGVPAVIAAFGGAVVLAVLAQRAARLDWTVAGRTLEVAPVALVMGLLILGFAAFELIPRLRAIRLDPKWLPLGGAVSGFFGGLSGHQGALRAAFLGRLELTPAQFAGTQAALACMVDLSRLIVYGTAVYLGRFTAASEGPQWKLVAFATVCAFAGSFIARRLLKKITIDFVHTVTGVLLLIVGVGLATGII